MKIRSLSSAQTRHLGQPGAGEAHVRRQHRISGRFPEGEGRHRWHSWQLINFLYQLSYSAVSSCFAILSNLPVGRPGICEEYLPTRNNRLHQQDKIGYSPYCLNF